MLLSADGNRENIRARTRVAIAPEMSGGNGEEKYELFVITTTRFVRLYVVRVCPVRLYECKCATGLYRKVRERVGASCARRRRRSVHRPTAPKRTMCTSLTGERPFLFVPRMGNGKPGRASVVD